ncbi:hypothetical protein [Thermococcus peptonophilus]|uniref:Uncharacterized protein n=1 Tax=Thermococcus peptonophilus TaxID=53952 RepID=A0A142CWU1_9EURY|nr:hypothetical protein [Thermococcus peptonophilus]AMQ19243.1 hypothetical protein A0127_08740 [Thermococcus peptonophilus]
MKALKIIGAILAVVVMFSILTAATMDESRTLVPFAAPDRWSPKGTQVNIISYGPIKVRYTVTEYSYTGFARDIENLSRLAGVGVSLKEGVVGYVAVVDLSSVPSTVLPLVRGKVEEEVDRLIEDEVFSMAGELGLEPLEKYTSGEDIVWRFSFPLELPGVLGENTIKEELPVYVRTRRVWHGKTLVVALVAYPNGILEVSGGKHSFGSLSVSITARIRLEYSDEAEDFLQWASNVELKEA